MKNKLVLIDGNSIAYRAFFALPLLSNDKGVHTNAIYGFTMMLLKILEDEKPSHMLVAFDAGKTTFRHSTFKEYKGGRQKTPPELSEQFPLVRQLLDTYGIARYELDNYEADDIIGTLAGQASKDEYEVKVISGDRDLLQLVDDRITVSMTKKGITEVEEYNPAAILEKYEISPEQIIDMKGLMGDKSDNIPGVPGIGEKTAIKLLKQFQTVEGLYDHLDEVSGAKLLQNLSENKEQALMSKQLATIDTNSPIELTVNDTMLPEADVNKVAEFFKSLGFTSLLAKLDLTESVEELEEIKFDELDSIEEKHLANHSSLIVEMIGENYHSEEIQGFGLSNEKGHFFIPTSVGLESDLFKKWLEDERVKKNVYDAKGAYVALKWRGIDLKGVNFDPLLASYIYDPAQSNKEFADLVNGKIDFSIQTAESIYGKGAKQAQPSQEVLAEYIVRKSIAISKLEETLEESLRQNSQYELLTELELPLTFILGDMEFEGVTVREETLRTMGSELANTLKVLEENIYELAGEKFNINSPKQLGVILFEKLNLPSGKKTKTGYSTSADVLEKLESEHEIIRLILHYRQVGKLNSTYVEGLLKVINQTDSKVHTRFNQVLAQTGRLSSIDPNLQNIPIRLEEGRKIRKAFVASKKDWVIFAADYSQIELRVLAHIAQDDNLMEAFKNDFDVHTKTAMDVFHVNADEVTSNMRRQAKAVNFGIVYGISDYGLSQSLGITRKEAAIFIEKYFASFPKVKDYMSDIVQKAKLDGFVSTILNRRRYIPEITSSNFNIRGFAERTAMNTPIQGSAADIIKKAMILLDERLKAEKLQAKLILQVHDELILEAPQEELATLEKLVPEVMEHAVELLVPLKVDYNSGESWFEAK
ncbi:MULTISPECIES: DNA polymerase I [unclassified Bacillus (in: firmicutes)]|uniref:DNA polymerase I n=1 Tax=unclassified Bacillus (in: firmicutes) TaxID=185979 RepID=UPI000BF16866|nr:MULTISPECIES: DNA polymerase I [unclassified Bacillus (in: firmicutes)]PEJ57853.1 DNA polymerase I [Bacillus sp. AFS002410]PEK99645.1 DNA polymerase I [Bacillus sp. AFS017336]